MAVEKRGAGFRAYWRNPVTGKIDKGEVRATLAEAEHDDMEVKWRIKHDPGSFQPAKKAPKVGTGGAIPPNRITLRQVSVAYLERKDLTEKTVKTSASALLSAIKAFGDKPAQEVSRTDLRKLEATLAANGSLMQSTVRRKVKLVCVVLSWARQTGLIEDHHVDGHRVKAGETSVEDPPTPKEVVRILDVAPPMLRRAILLSYYLGLRFGPSENLSAKWENFDAEEATLRVRCEKNKERPWRKVCIAPSLLQEMLGWLSEDAGGSEFIVHRGGQPYPNLDAPWKAALSAAKISRRIRPYDLRHAFCTEVLASGADRKAVALSMGHQSTKMVDRVYQHVLDRQRRGVAEAVPDILSGVQSGVQEAHNVPEIASTQITNIQ